MTTEKQSAKCAACELSEHSLPNCLYMFLEKAKGKFHTHEDQQKEVNKKIKENAQLQKKVNRLRKKKQKAGEISVLSGRDDQD